MKLEAFLKKNMKRLIRLEREFDKLFEGTVSYTCIRVEISRFRMAAIDEIQAISVWVEPTETCYLLEDFANMTAMIAQIKHDVKEVRAK